MIISKYIGVATDGDVGIEIEVEGERLPPSTDDWRKERDGSLRGPDTGEYVLRKPIPIKDVSKKLNNLKSWFEVHNSEFYESPRAGVHVHINVSDLSFKQAMTMICIYIILEEFFIKFCDKSRDGNLFCLPSYNASYLLSQLRESCATDRVDNLNTDNLRYAAINVKSLFKYGSIEFRALESTYNFDKIATWCGMLYKLKLAALEYDNPEQLMLSFSKNDYARMVDNIMGEYTQHFFKHKNVQDMVRGGIIRAQDIAFSRDWNISNLNIFSKKAGVFN